MPPPQLLFVQLPQQPRTLPGMKCAGCMGTISRNNVHINCGICDGKYARDYILRLMKRGP